VVALLCLIGRITISLYAFRRLHVADGFAMLAFALLVSNGVCHPFHSNTMVFSCYQNPSPRTALSQPSFLHSTDWQRLSPPSCLRPCTNFLPSAWAENSQHQHSLSEDHTTSNASSRRRCFSGLVCGASRHPFWHSSFNLRNA